MRCICSSFSNSSVPSSQPSHMISRNQSRLPRPKSDSSFNLLNLKCWEFCSWTPTVWFLFKIESENGSSNGKIKAFICRLGSRHHHLFLHRPTGTPTVVRRTSRMSRVAQKLEYTKNIFSPIRSPPDLFLRSIQATWPGSLPGLKQVLRGIAKLSSNLTTAVST